MRHALILQQAILDGTADAEVVSGALSEAESWIRPLSDTGRRLYARLLASVDRQDGAVLQRMRRNPRATAVLFALLPAPEAMRLFAPVERYDENWLTDVERATPRGSPLAAMVDGRAGFLRAVYALMRIIQRAREVARSLSPPAM